MINYMHSKKIIFAIALFASIYCVDVYELQAQPEVAAQNNLGAQTLTLENAISSGQTPPFVYNRERPDPFFPFLSQEIMKAEAKAKEELGGTQKYEPAQLTLVAIVSGKRGLLAMVQDSSGVGYVLRKGTKIGETGEVVQITHDKVVIEQSLKNLTGERTSRKVEMSLNKEGEK